jgi:hypothetical protein
VLAEQEHQVVVGMSQVIGHRGWRLWDRVLSETAICIGVMWLVTWIVGELL